MVFPEPVCADPMQSRPCNIGGMHAAWTGVGAFIDMDPKALARKGATPSEPKSLPLLVDVILAAL